MRFRTPAVLVAVLAAGPSLAAAAGPRPAGASLGAAVSVAAGPRPAGHFATRCHRRRHHRCARAPHCRPRAHHCPASRKRPVAKHAPTPSPPLPRRLEIDENDQGAAPQPYSLTASHNPVAAGVVQFNVYNFGQDAHTFAIEDAGGRQVAFVGVPASQPQIAVPLSARLSAGRYTLLCTLAGHAGLGMRASLTVR